MSMILEEIAMALSDMPVLIMIDQDFTYYPQYVLAPGETRPNEFTIIDVEQIPGSGGMRLTVTGRTPQQLCNNTGTSRVMSVLNAEDNGAGEIRLTVWSTAGMTTDVAPTNGPSRFVYGVGGVPNADGHWRKTVVNGTQMDLQGSSWAGSSFTGAGPCVIATTTNPCHNQIWTTGVLGTTAANGIHLAKEAGVDKIDLWYGWPDRFPFTIRGGAVHNDLLYVPQHNGAYVSGGRGARIEGVTVTHPFTGAPGAGASQHGRHCDHWKFRPNVAVTRLDRAAADNPASYPTIGGRTVTAVYRKSMPSADPNTGSGPLGRLRHHLFLKLDGVLANGNYVLDLSAIGLSATTAFNFHDKRTRAIFSLTNHTGHRPSDVYKKGKFAGYIPYADNEGVVTLPFNEAHLIDADEDIVQTFPLITRLGADNVEANGGLWTNAFENSTITAVNASPITPLVRLTLGGSGSALLLPPTEKCFIRDSNVPSIEGEWTFNRISSTQIDLVDSTFVAGTPSAAFIKGRVPYTSAQRRWAITSINKTVIPCSVTVPGHGFVENEYVRGERIGAQNPVGQRGPNFLDGNHFNQGNMFAYKVHIVDANTVTLRVLDGNSLNATALPAWNGGGGFLCAIAWGNPTRTNVYDVDFSEFTTTGTFKLYYPGIGVSDPIPIQENAWHEAGKVYAAGEYHQRMMIHLDGRFGWDFGPVYKHGHNGVLVQKSYLPHKLTSQGFTDRGINPSTWTTSTAYKPGYVRNTGTGTTGYMCRIAHTSPASGTFAAYRTANPTHWEQFFFFADVAVSMAGFPPWRIEGEYYDNDVIGGWRDASDDDHFAGHTAVAYDCLNVLEFAGAGGAATNYNLPNPSEVTDSGFWNGTDGMPDMLKVAVHGLYPYLRGQWANGGVPSGFMGATVPRCHDDSEGSIWELAEDRRGPIFGWAPDHYTTFVLAGNFAKMAIVLRLFGYNTQADAFETAAIDAWDFAWGIFTSVANAGGGKDNYYKTELGLKAKMTGWNGTYMPAGWTDTEYAMAMGVLDLYLDEFPAHAYAAAVLFRLTEDVQYRNAFNTVFVVGSLETNRGRAHWEMYNSNESLWNATTLSLMNASEEKWIEMKISQDTKQTGVTVEGNVIGLSSYDWMGSSNQGVIFGDLVNTWKDGEEMVRLWARGQVDAAPEAFPLQYLQSYYGWFGGINQMGRTTINGLGNRWLEHQHARNKIDLDGSAPRGTPTYTFTPWNFGAGLFSGGPGPGIFSQAYTVDPDPVTTPGADEREMWPHPHHWPAIEPWWKQNQQNIGASEYTIGGNSGPNFAQCTLLHMRGNNSETTVPPGKRARLKAI